jgi:hypothetical protein
MLLDADLVTKLNSQPVDKLRHAYMKGQFDLSSRAIKYLNPATLDATRPGMIGRFIHRLFNRGERVTRLLRDSQTANDIAESILFIKKSEVLDESQKAQLEEVNQSLERMFATRDFLVKNPAKVELAYQFLAAQYLSSADEGATLSQADIDIIKSQWKSLLANDTKEAFKDIEKKIDHLRGKGLADLVKNLSTEEAKNVAAAVDRLLLEQNEFLIGVQSLKASLDDLRYDRLKFPTDSPEAKLQATIRALGLEYQDYETIQSLKSKSVELQGILDQFQLAYSEIKPLENEFTTAIFRATQAKFDLERTIEANKNKLSDQEIQSLQSISKILEESFLERVGLTAPPRLESRQDFAEIRAFQVELNKYFNNPSTSEKLDSLESQMEEFATKYNESKLLDDLQKNTPMFPSICWIPWRKPAIGLLVSMKIIIIKK